MDINTEIKALALNYGLSGTLAQIYGQAAQSAQSLVIKTGRDQLLETGVGRLFDIQGLPHSAMSRQDKEPKVFTGMCASDNRERLARIEPNWPHRVLEECLALTIACEAACDDKLSPVIYHRALRSIYLGKELSEAFEDTSYLVYAHYHNGKTTDLGKGIESACIDRYGRNAAGFPNYINQRKVYEGFWNQTTTCVLEAKLSMV